MDITKVVFDTDMGIDDAWALITLLKCESRCKFQVKAITTCFGNTQLIHASQNTLFMLNLLQRMDIPVYAGAKNGILLKPDYKPSFFAPDGFKGIIPASNKPSLDLMQKKHAVEAIRELIEEVYYTFKMKIITLIGFNIFLEST
jgi:purine nucleosidase